MTARVSTNLENSGDVSEHRKVMEFSGNSVQPQRKLTLCSGCSLCQAVHMQPSVSSARKLLIWAIWDDRLLLVTWCGITLQKVIVAYTVCCNNVRKSIIMALENSGNSFSLRPTKYVMDTLTTAKLFIYLACNGNSRKIFGHWQKCVALCVLWCLDCCLSVLSTCSLESDSYHWFLANVNSRSLFAVARPSVCRL